MGNKAQVNSIMTVTRSEKEQGREHKVTGGTNFQNKTGDNWKQDKE